jgi:MFS transporter, DHA2 family, multidrug resistance protein
MSVDYAQDQLVFANIVRAFGQPLTIVPLATMATALIAQERAPSGSAIFNIARNLGGSVGIAILSTMLIRREQFHSERIGESITELNLPVQQRLHQLSDHFISVGFDPVSATQKAYQTINSVVQRESFILAFNDCFEIIAIGLLIGAVLVWLCKRPPIGSQGGGH